MVIGVHVFQVTDVVSNGTNSDMKQRPVAALGLAWANMVTTRLQLSRTAHTVPDPHWATLAVSVRTLEVVFSSHLPNDTCHFIVTRAGVFGIS